MDGLGGRRSVDGHAGAEASQLALEEHLLFGVGFFVQQGQGLQLGRDRHGEVTRGGMGGRQGGLVVGVQGVGFAGQLSQANGLLRIPESAVLRRGQEPGEVVGDGRSFVDEFQIKGAAILDGGQGVISGLLGRDTEAGVDFGRVRSCGQCEPELGSGFIEPPLGVVYECQAQA